MVESVLVIGYNARVIACSAKRAGYKVYSVSHYDDLDQARCSDRVEVFGDMPQDLKPYIEMFNPDYVTLGSGFEDADIDRSLVLGSDPKIAKDVTNKVWLAKKLEKLGIRQPKLYNRNNVEFPCVAKPISGGGGYKNYIVKDESMLPDEKEYFLQEFIEGRPLSVSVLSSESEAKPITLNEILVGKKWLGQELVHGYCGNVTPYKTRFHDEMFDMSKKLIEALGLVGSNGIDFMVNETGPYVLEVNPRFQGSLDSVELAIKDNLFKLHKDAIEGKLREVKVKQFGIRGIYFARRHTKVVGNMLKPGLADIPKAGNTFERGEAIVSVLGHGPTRGTAVSMLKENLKFAKSKVKATGPIEGPIRHGA